ncbi:unnamed protein product [Parnassius apollo]|uniref:(apollo) hypothetical protein n=1 Tax=Parnassius apollo TaxID=110799 RepID=A0A8S3XP16_PARAO|nr:unnamed protein product [Parnassius apollo]
MVVGETKRTANIMDGIENTGDVRLHDHRLRLKQRFDIVRKLGQGTYGKVQLGINKKTGQEVAIKTIKKCKIESEADLIRIRREVQIMSSVRHPNIVHIYEVFENSEKMILVMEYCSGGELYDYLSQKKVLEEEEARRLFRQIATAVYYCHIHKICHRDLKLENVLLDDTGSAKIADFGLSNVFKETSLLSTFCGSPLYASPEIVKGTPYIGPEVDCWSLGVLLYTLVYGAMPFDGSNFKRLVRQISNGDYYEPKNPSTASPLIRDMLTVDPLKRADIAYICDHTWVNAGCSTSCLEVAEALAAETPVRLDLLLSLAPAAPAHGNSVVVPAENELGPEESCTDLTTSTSVPVEPSNSAEKRILELVAEGGEDAIKPSPTRTIVSAGENKRKLELAMSASGLQRKKEKVASCASVAQLPSALPEEPSPDSPPAEEPLPAEPLQPSLKSSATITIAPAPVELAKDATVDISKQIPNEEEAEDITKSRVTVKKKITSPKGEEKESPEKQDDVKIDEPKSASVATATDKLTSLSLTQQVPAATTPAPAKPKKLSIGGHVGSFKEQFERRASLTAAPEIKRNVSKPVVSKIAKPKAQSEDRELSGKSSDNGTVRLQQIGIEPSQTPIEEVREINRSGVKKTESEPMHNTTQVDPSVLLQDARRSLQNSMAKLVEEKAGKPPMPYGRSSSAGVTSLSSPPGTPPAAPPAPRLYRTEAQHRVDDHRHRGVSVERIIPIHMAAEDAAASPPPRPGPAPAPASAPAAPTPPRTHTPLRRLASTESPTSETCSSPGEPIKKSAREFIIPIAVEGKGYVTPRQRSLEPERRTRVHHAHKPRRISSLVSGGESEEEDDTHMHRLRSSRAARAESVSSGEEDEEDEGFHLLTAENLFSTLLHRVRALTQRLNGEDGPGFSQHPHSLFNNLQSPFFNSPHLPRRHLIICYSKLYFIAQARRLGFARLALGLGIDVQQEPAADAASWVARYTACSDQIFTSQRQQRQPQTRHKRHTRIGSCKKTGKKHQSSKAKQTDTERGLDLSDLDLSSIEFSEREMRALSGLTPALSRRLQQQLLAHLPPAAARTLRRTLSLNAAPPTRTPRAPRAASSEHDQLAPDTDDKLHPRDLTPKPDDIINVQKNDIAAVTKNANIQIQENITVAKDVKQDRYSRSCSVKSIDDDASIENPQEKIHTDKTSTPVDIYKKEIDKPSSTKETEEKRIVDMDEFIELPSTHVSQFCTLPRPKRNSATSNDSVSPSSIVDTVDYDYSTKCLGKESNQSRGSNMRYTPDRPLLSKYLIPERHLSLDESYSSDCSSILSEPSYIAAYGSSSLGNTSGMGFRRHSMRLAGDQPKKRISRFLRSDFFDTPPDENIYAKHKKEKELETQKILKEIREKKNKSLDSPKSPVDVNDPTSLHNDESTYLRKCLSPVSNILSKERSRSTTPFFPILDNIKETNLDTSLTVADLNKTSNVNDTELKNHKQCLNNNTLKDKETKMLRPKSYPLKNLNTLEESNKVMLEESCAVKNREDDERKLPRETKLIRPKSYPTSSPSPEKNYLNRNGKKDELKNSSILKEDNINQDSKSDVEVSFSVTLPKKKLISISKPDPNKKQQLPEQETELRTDVTPTLVLKKYKIIKEDKEPQNKVDNTVHIGNGTVVENAETNESSVGNSAIKMTETKKIDSETSNKKTVRKKIVKKVSSKSKSDLVDNQESTDVNNSSEKKKIVKKVKEKSMDDSPKEVTIVKKKSVLQSIGHKLEKLASSKSNSPEKASQGSIGSNDSKKESLKLSRMQREQSVPVTTDPPTESNLIKRAVTLTNVAALENQNVTNQNKTTVSKVLGLFKKFEPKEKSLKSGVEKSVNENIINFSKINKHDSQTETNLDSDKEKPKRPTSLLLNGLGRKSKNNKATSDSISVNSLENDEQLVLKKENEPKNIRNTLKLDFSRLPRVKKIVPTNPVIEPQVMNISSGDKDIFEKNGHIPDSSNTKAETNEVHCRSRSRSRSIYSNSDIRSEHSADIKVLDKISDSTLPKTSVLNTTRNRDSISPEKEDIVDRIRRKSFYSRFNEKKQRRKSSLVGPGATEYDPIAKLHSPPTEPKFDVSPNSPIKYDLSPGFSVASDLSPSTDRYRSLLTDHPSTKNRYDGLNDKIDTYRSLDRNDFRKFSSGRSYLDYDQPATFGTHRYSRTKSLLDSSDSNEDHSLSHLREPQRYSRTNSLYTPGNYATYRPKRTRNSAIILKESEKEPSPENILDKIRNRKISISVTRKPDAADLLARSNVPSKGESDSPECPEKID